jgi:hypothetical protein
VAFAFAYTAVEVEIVVPLSPNVVVEEPSKVFLGRIGDTGIDIIANALSTNINGGDNANEERW